MKVLQLIFSIFFLFSVPLNAQWTSFDLSNINTEEFEKQVAPLLKTTSILINRHFFNQINENGRFNLGVSYSQGISLTGESQSSELICGYPNVAGSVVITDNLLLKGNMSTFKSNNDIVQSFAYGFGLNLTNREKNNWRSSVLFSQLRGPDDIKIRSMDAAIINEFEVGKVSLFAGFGLNSYNAKILINTSDSIPRSIKDNANHLLFGAQLNTGRIIIVPILQVNFDVVIISIEISRAFK